MEKQLMERIEALSIENAKLKIEVQQHEVDRYTMRQEVSNSKSNLDLTWAMTDQVVAEKNLLEAQLSEMLEYAANMINEAVTSDMVDAAPEELEETVDLHLQGWPQTLIDHYHDKYTEVEIVEETEPIEEDQPIEPGDPNLH